MLLAHLCCRTPSVAANNKQAYPCCLRGTVLCWGASTVRDQAVVCEHPEQHAPCAVDGGPLHGLLSQSLSNDLQGCIAFHQPGQCLCPSLQCVAKVDFLRSWVSDAPSYESSLIHYISCVCWNCAKELTGAYIC